jgi:hypothetical protein
VPVEAMTDILRVAVFVVPILGFAITYRLAIELKRTPRPTGGRAPAIRLRRTATGGFEEIEPD